MSNDTVYGKSFLLWHDWTNESKANDLLGDIDMNEALDDGSHYIAIYEFCGFVFIGLAAAYLCLAIGTINLKSRIAGLGTLCIMSVCNFIALIVTAVYRFNTLGKLAALSTCPTKYD